MGVPGEASWLWNQCPHILEWFLQKTRKQVFKGHWFFIKFPEQAPSPNQNHWKDLFSVNKRSEVPECQSSDNRPGLKIEHHKCSSDSLAHKTRMPPMEENVTHRLSHLESEDQRDDVLFDTAQLPFKKKVSVCLIISVWEVMVLEFISLHKMSWIHFSLLLDWKASEPGTSPVASKPRETSENVLSLESVHIWQASSVQPWLRGSCSGHVMSSLELFKKNIKKWFLADVGKFKESDLNFELKKLLLSRF